MKKVAVVTGGNRGMGKETCRQLGEAGFEVVLTSRSVGDGKKATKELQKEGLNVVFHKLDVAKDEDVKKLANFVKKEYGKVDVVVNNAAAYIDGSTNSVLDLKTTILHKTLDVNLSGPLRIAKAFHRLFNKGGRLINISSTSGQLSTMSYGRSPAYGISKTALNALTVKLANALPNVSVNSVHPGWVRTKMGGKFAPRSVKKGVETAIWLATTPNPPTGKFLADKKEIDWEMKNKSNNCWKKKEEGQVDCNDLISCHCKKLIKFIECSARHNPYGCALESVIKNWAKANLKDSGTDLQTMLSRLTSQGYIVHFGNGYTSTGKL